MANDKAFKIKNGLSATRYLGSNGTSTSGITTYDVAGARYANKQISIGSQENTPRGIAFKTDGTKMFIVGSGSNTVYQYSLSTAWDLSTASYDSVSFGLTGQEASVSGIRFKPDGTKMFIVGYSGDSVYEYSLSTAWDASTLSYSSTSFSVSSQDSAPLGLDFKSDGTKMYIAANSGDAIQQYALSTAWDLSTASWENISLDVNDTTGGESVVADVQFKSDGTKMYVLGSSAEKIYIYSLSTAWDVSTASYDNQTVDMGLGSSTNPNTLGFTIGDSGKKLYVADAAIQKIEQFTIEGSTQTLDLSVGNFFSITTSGTTSISFTNPPASGAVFAFSVEITGSGTSYLSWPTSIKWEEIDPYQGAVSPSSPADGEKDLFVFFTKDGGTTYYAKQAGNAIS